MSRRAAAEIHATVALALRRAGCSFSKIASAPGVSGRPMFHDRSGAYRAVARARRREPDEIDRLTEYARIHQALARADVDANTRRAVIEAVDRLVAASRPAQALQKARIEEHPPPRLPRESTR